MSTKLNQKINWVFKHCLQTFYDHKNGSHENALGNARKCAEAVCRAIILNHFGEINGEEIILGRIDARLNPIHPTYGKHEIPAFKKLLSVCRGLPSVNQALYFRFEDIRWGGNNASHDPISENSNITKDSVELCLIQLKEVLRWFWMEYLRKPIPLEIVESFSGKIDETHLSWQENSEWDKLYQDSNYFSAEQRYFLVSPPNFKGLSNNQLSVLARINWSLIFDFDPSSKETGLFNATKDHITNRQIRPITIEQRDQQDLISSSDYALNWFFANGISSLPATISKSPREWKTTLKYGALTQKLIKEALGAKVRNLAVVYLWDDKQYIRTIIEGIDQNVSNVKLTSHFICSQNDDSISDLTDEFSEYGVRLYRMEVSEFIEGVNGTIQSTWKNKKGTMHVPSRVNGGNDAYIDISAKYLSFTDRNVEVVYQGIANETTISSEDYSFFKGNIISWKELEVDTEVRRNKLVELTAKATKWLETSKGGYSIELHHKPGAGGTTLARRLAFDLHTKYPTVLITKYRKGWTNIALFDLAELTQKPILAIVEAYNITQNELNALIRKINEDKKHVVVIYVRRVFQNSPNEKDTTGRIVYLDDRVADLAERDRFVARYSQIALPQSKPLIKSMSEQNPHQCEIIDFALTAYEDEFSSESLRNYIHNYLGKLSASQLKFVGFASMIYYYTQKECSELWFQSLFNNETLSDQLTQKPFEERFIKRLFIQQIGDNYEFTGFWRPRFSRFATEILTLTLAGLNTNAGKDDWKDFLSRWGVELIKECRASNEYLTEETREMLKSLLLDRDNEDVLGKNDLAATSVTAERKFSQLIRHISNRDQQLEIFKTLVECYPYETHFLGHLGRFLYETATDSNDYENAENEISKALELGEGDFNLWHIKGMCNRRRIEFLVRSNTSEYSEDELVDLEEIVQELAETASEDFARSRQLNTHNLHSHAAQIQMLLSVINFGRQITNTESKEHFVSDKKNIWYGNQLDKVLELIDEAQYIIELSKDLDQSKVIKKSKDMIEGCEGSVFNLLGDFSKAINRFKNLGESAERSARPYFRKMFVYATLAGKNKVNSRNLRNAWNKLSGHEYIELRRALESNIREQPDNSHHFKLWLQAVRYSNAYISLDDCISTVKVWYDNSLAYEIAHLEAAYYMYVLNASKAISSGDTWGEFNVVEARKYKDECREKRINDKFSFEWYGAGDGVKRLVHHSVLGRMNSDKRFFEDPSPLAHVEGIITNIYDKQKGRIKLKCGFEAFFVPANGGFDVEDETSLVRFYVGFRQDGLVAWEVQKVKNLEPVVNLVSPEVDIEGFDDEDDEVSTLAENQHQVPVNLVPKTVKASFEETKLKGLTIVGKIDLSQWERFKKRKAG